MKVKISTREFIHMLDAAKEIDRQFPWLRQAMWLFDHSTDFAAGEH
jgi:hypothetical protein